MKLTHNATVRQRLGSVRQPFTLIARRGWRRIALPAAVDEAMRRAMSNRVLISRTKALLAAAEPGPWAVGPMGIYIVCASGSVADTPCGYQEPPPPEGAVVRIRGFGRSAPQEANMALIAAAPSLLQKLVAALEVAEQGEGD